MVKKVAPATNPNAYVSALSDWQRDFVEALRAAVKEALRKETPLERATVLELVRAAVALNETVGDPTKAA
jgi:hypothetical protein